MGDDMAEHGRIFQCLRRHIDGGREQSKKTGGANGIRLINRKAGLFAFYRLPGPPQAEGKVKVDRREVRADPQRSGEEIGWGEREGPVSCWEEARDVMPSKEESIPAVSIWTGGTFITENPVSPKLNGRRRRSRTMAQRAYCSRRLIAAVRICRRTRNPASRTEELMIHVNIMLFLQFS